MVWPRRHVNRSGSVVPPVCAALLLLTLGVPPGPASAGAGPVHQAEAPSDTYWRDLIVFLQAIDEILAGTQAPRQIPPIASESDALAWAWDTAQRFEQHGIDPDLTEDQVLCGLTDVASARAMILDNPDMFTDPYWGTFLITLDQIEIGLSTVAPAGGL